MNTKVQAAIEKVATSFPSLYSKDDVIAVLNNLADELGEETPAVGALSEEQLKTLRTRLRETIEDTADNLDAEELVDFSSATMSMNYGNEVELESIDVNSRSIATELTESAIQVVEDFFEELKEQQEKAQEVAEEENAG